MIRALCNDETSTHKEDEPIGPLVQQPLITSCIIKGLSPISKGCLLRNNKEIDVISCGPNIGFLPLVSIVSHKNEPCREG